jgi:hypothetical protein
VGGGVQLGPLCTAATNRPIVPAPGDYDDGEIGGMMIGRENRSLSYGTALTYCIYLEGLQPRIRCSSETLVVFTYLPDYRVVSQPIRPKSLLP